jgi:hypothetical protein
LRQGFFAVRELVFGVERDAKTILCARPHCSCRCTACTLLRCAAMRAYGARYRRALAAGSTAPRVKLH